MYLGRLEYEKGIHDAIAALPAFGVLIPARR